MQANRSAIQLIGLIMSKQTLDVNHALDLIQILNSSPASCRDIITILQDIFKHEKSGKILVAVNALQYFVKNCNINFHFAANRESFQKRLLSLLNRIRGKTNLIKQLNSNTDNWCRIQAKVLYIIQLWYDAFILEQSKYPHIINTYKVLRKENITFPPRSKNEKNLMAVETQSPIFDNIDQIAFEDQKKFNKKLAAMGLGHLQTALKQNIEMTDNIQVLQKKIFHNNYPKSNNNESKEKKRKQVNIDDISEKIAIIQSTQNGTLETLKVIEDIKSAIEFGVVKPNEEKYWHEIKQAANKLVQEWQERNQQLVKQQQQKYLQKKLGLIGQKPSINNYQQQPIGSSQKKQQPKIQNNNFDLLDDFEGFNISEKKQQVTLSASQKMQDMNLLDL